MGVPVLILGESGSGKTYSIKNLDPNRVGIFSVEKNRLPFKHNFKIAKNAGYKQILSSLANPSLDTYVVDDSTFLMINQVFDKIKEQGYSKYADIAKNFRDMIHIVNLKTPDNVVVYFMHHIEYTSNGKIKAKTAGKMLDDVLDVSSCFDIVLYAEANNKEHTFLTQNDGVVPAKSPEGMFEERIPNDLAFVDKTIREYYGLEAKNEERSN